MIKSELVLRLAYRNPHLSGPDIERVVNTILGRISDALIAGDRVELRGLGGQPPLKWSALWYGF